MAVLTERISNARSALEMQAAEYERRLAELNHEADRIARISAASVSSDKFDDYRQSHQKTLELLFGQIEHRLAALEQWRAKAIGIASVMVLISAAIGATVVRVLLGS